MKNQHEFSSTNLSYFKRWILSYASQMPKLQNISVNLYTYRDQSQDVGIRRSFIKQLDGLTSVGQFTELRLIAMEDALRWRSRKAAKYLFVHWKRGSNPPLQLVDPAISFKEECCIGSFATSSDHEKASEEVEDAYPDYYNDDSEEEDEMRLYLAACGE